MPLIPPLVILNISTIWAELTIILYILMVSAQIVQQQFYSILKTISLKIKIPLFLQTLKIIYLIMNKNYSLFYKKKERMDGPQVK